MNCHNQYRGSRTPCQLPRATFFQPYPCPSTRSFPLPAPSSRPRPLAERAPPAVRRARDGCASFRPRPAARPDPRGAPVYPDRRPAPRSRRARRQLPAGRTGLDAARVVAGGGSDALRTAQPALSRCRRLRFDARMVDSAPAVRLPAPRSAPRGPGQPARHPSPPGSTRLQPGFACRRRIRLPRAAPDSASSACLGPSPRSDRRPSPMLPPLSAPDRCPPARPRGCVHVRQPVQVLARCPGQCSPPISAPSTACRRRPPARHQPLQPPRPGPRVPDRPHPAPPLSSRPPR